MKKACKYVSKEVVTRGRDLPKQCFHPRWDFMKEYQDAHPIDERTSIEKPKDKEKIKMNKKKRKQMERIKF